MAGRAAAPQHEAAAGPVSRQEARGREVIGDDDGAGRDRRLGAAAQAVEQAFAQVGDVGGTTTEVGIVGSGEIGDLRIQHLAPGVVRRRPRGDGGEYRIGERGILQHRQLEFQDAGFGLVRRRFDQPGERGPVALQRGAEAGTLLGRRAGAPPPARGRHQADQAPGGKAGRRRRTLQRQRGRSRLKPHR